MLGVPCLCDDEGPPSQVFLSSSRERKNFASCWAWCSCSKKSIVSPATRLLAFVYIPPAIMFVRSRICSGLSRQQPFHRLSAVSSNGRNGFFSSAVKLAPKQPIAGESTQKKDTASEKASQAGRRKTAANTSLRRVAVEAQRSRYGILSRSQLSEKGTGQFKVVLHEFTVLLRVPDL